MKCGLVVVFQVLSEGLYVSVVSEVDPCRDYRDVTGSECVLIGVGGIRFTVEVFAGHLEGLLCILVGAQTAKLFLPKSVGLPTYFHSTERAGGDVYIEAGALHESMFQDFVNQIPDHRSGVAEVRLRATVAEREADGRNADDTSLDGCSHRTAIDDTDGGVGAMVDARNDKVRTTMDEEPMEGKFDTIDRSAAGGIDGGLAIVAHRGQYDRASAGETTSVTGSGGVRGNDYDAPYAFQTLHQVVDARSMDSIVIGH